MGVAPGAGAGVTARADGRQGGPRGGRLPQLRQGVGEEADGAAAGGALLAELGAVAGGVQPGLEDAVGKGAAVAAATGPLAILWAGRGAVGVDAGVATAGLLAWMEEWAGPPVVQHARLGALFDLERKHAKFVRIWFLRDARQAAPLQRGHHCHACVTLLNASWLYILGSVIATFRSTQNYFLPAGAL